MYYVIHTEYVGPNKKSSTGAIIGDSRVMTIESEPGRTNLSNEIKKNGWLGTTNDIYRTACGEYETEEQALEYINAQGFTEKGDQPGSWITPAASREQWAADEWYLNVDTEESVCVEMGITTKSTDAELAELADKAEKEAAANDIQLHGALELFERLRDELKEDQE